MAFATLLLCAFFLSSLSYGRSETLRKPSDFRSTCNQIATAISGASRVFFPRTCIIPCSPSSKLMSNEATPEYMTDIWHAAISSSEVSACSVEPGSSEDVSKIVSYLLVSPHIDSSDLYFHSYASLDQAELRSQ